MGQGWHPRPENGVRWASGDAWLSYFNPHDRPMESAVRLELVGVTPRDVTLLHNGRAAGTVRAAEEPVVLELKSFMLAPGVNTFCLRSDEPAKRLSAGRYQLRAFGLKGSGIRVIAAPGGEEWTY
jgi:hypothetical protein